MKSVALHNLGCKVNAYEIEVMQQKLQEKGYGIVPFDSAADVYIINTCTVTNMADRKSRQMLHRAKKRNPAAVVVAVGCYVQTGQEEALLDGSIDLAIGNNRKKDVVEILEAFLKEREEKKQKDDPVAAKTLDHTSVIEIGRTEEYEEMTLEETVDHTRAYIKVQDGCNQFCAYCIIPFARGRVRSRRPEDVLEEIRGLAEKGYREVVITGIHLSSYGMDFIKKQEGDYLEADGDVRQEAIRRAYLLRLIEAIHALEGIDRIRLGSLEPRIITEAFAQRLAELPKVCPHFHLSLQSGCNETLRRMNRHYSAEEYYEKVKLLRRYFDAPAITTDVIVGFPGETEEEFETTRQFLEQVNFFEMHIFKYSRRKGTAADRMPGQVPEAVKTERSSRLLCLEQKMSGAYRSTYIGKEMQILLEEKKEIDGREYWIGHDRNYVKGAVLAEKGAQNQIAAGIVRGFLTEEILTLEEIH